MPKSKKFDKRKAVTFQLVHRSQQDPLVVDETAPQRVLLPIENKDATRNREECIEEQQKYGIFYDDDFNYLQHLKDVKDNKMEWPEHAEEELTKRQEQLHLNLPSSVFASEVEEEVGMLNKAAPVSGLQLHLDPDVVAAMDDDFNFSDPENILEDDFMELAHGIASDQELDINDEIEIDSNYDEEIDELGSLQGSQHLFDKAETKSRFTNYSMTSSVIRRNEQLTLLDARFEKMYASYDDNQIGALDCEEIEGYIPENSDILLQYAEEFKKSQERQHLDDLDDNKVKNKTRELCLLDRESDEEEEEFETIIVHEKPKWDCQSILSTYSNRYNRPKIIPDPPSQKKKKIVIDKKSGIPKNILDSKKLTDKTLNVLNEENGEFKTKELGSGSVGGQSLSSQLSVLSIRPKDETPEERRQRKNNLKEYRRERRLEKKMNKVAFAEEAKRQKKIIINNKNNVQGNKIL